MKKVLGGRCTGTLNMWEKMHEAKKQVELQIKALMKKKKCG